MIIDNEMLKKVKEIGKFVFRDKEGQKYIILAVNEQNEVLLEKPTL